MLQTIRYSGSLNGKFIKAALPITVQVKHESQDTRKELPAVQVNKYPNAIAARLRRGTGGRSSFNGMVCTIFGGTGLLGPLLANKLGKIGTQLILPHRADQIDIRPLKLTGDLGQVILLPFYLRHEESIRKAMKYSDVVINCIGKVNETASFTYDEVHVDGCRRIARIARECGVKRFIHLSALNCAPNPKGHILKNGSGFLRSKYYGELAVRDEFPDAIIFRPANIFGDCDSFLSPLAEIYRRQYKKLPLWNKGMGVYKQPVFSVDVVQGIVNSIFDNDAIGRTYEAVGPRKYEFREIAEYVGRIIQKDEQFEYRITNMKYSPLFRLRVTVFGHYRKYPHLCWDQVEREMVTDELTGHPTLEDLGVSLTYLEDKAPYLLERHRKYGYYDHELGEFPPAAPPKYVTLEH